MPQRAVLIEDAQHLLPRLRGRQETLPQGSSAKHPGHTLYGCATVPGYTWGQAGQGE